ncbi:MAG: hypothetical protein KatS3mg115_2127 [Candidatus Poribacteria bacterium]|nr:MAG: hypothetical protein KatS3mg115_2127 [Candidatus Poribacteria bacterium]
MVREDHGTIEQPITVELGRPTTVEVKLSPAATDRTSSRTLAEIARSANEALNRYLQLMGQGQPVEAAQALEQLRQDLEELQRYAQANLPEVSAAPQADSSTAVIQKALKPTDDRPPLPRSSTSTPTVSR